MDKTIAQMRQDLALTGYAETTCRSYLRTVTRLQERFGRPIADLTRDEVRQFVSEVLESKRSASSRRMDIGGLAFLYRKTLGRPEMVSFVSWPTGHSPLPTILSIEEVDAVLRAIDHPVYKAIAVVIYGTGLRLSEALALEVGDIDGSRCVLRVRHGKGDKARDVTLSRTLYEWLRRYWRRQQPPKPYLFATHQTGLPPTQPAMGHALHLAARAASVKKRVTPHVLRHCYATHLLEAGVDIRVVQELLGHASIRSTQRYTRVTQKLALETPSPLDLLPKKKR